MTLANEALSKGWIHDAKKFYKKTGIDEKQRNQILATSAMGRSLPKTALKYYKKAGYENGERGDVVTIMRLVEIYKSLGKQKETEELQKRL